jgi:hypothetical protein
MYSKFISFEEIVEGIKDDTGITNLTNSYGKIRRLIFRCHQDIGYGASLILKRVTYSIENGNIINTNGVLKIKLPEDITFIEAIGMCHEGMCPGSYNIQGNYLFICDKKVRKFSLIYYTLLCDGNGNPAVSLNNKEAVISGVAYFMYKQRRWNDKGSRAVLQELQTYYEDRIGEARGANVMPDSKEEYSRIASAFKRSYSQTLIYNNERACYCCIEESDVVIAPSDNATSFIYEWQFDDLINNIDFAPLVNQEFLDLQNTIPLNTFLSGTLISYTKIGRICFAITNTTENKYAIRDIFNNNITNIVFDSYYNSQANMQIFISKEYYTFGSIYFMLTPN